MHVFTKEYGSQCSLRCLNVKQICVDDIISRSRREEIKTTIEKAKLGRHVAHIVVENMIS